MRAINTKKHGMYLKAKPLIASHGGSILLAIVSNLLMRTAEPSDAATHGKYQPLVRIRSFVYGLLCIRIGGELSFTERHVVVYGPAKCSLFRAYGFLAPGPASRSPPRCPNRAPCI